MSFLNALKNKAPVPTFNQPTTAQAAPIKQTVKPTAAQSASQPIAAPITVTINRVLNRGRIDVRFSSKPEARICADLRANGFNWNPTEKTWYHKDSSASREYLRCTFDAQDLTEPEETPKETTPIVNDTANNGTVPDKSTPQQETQETSEVSPSHPHESDTFQVYKNQVNELMVSLNLSAADLMIYAIDYLYKQTIAN